MYTLETPITAVRGIGSVTQEKLAQQAIGTVGDLLLSVPLRYEDRSDLRLIANAEEQVLITIEATVQTCSSFYKNKKLIVTATVADESGKLKLMWFNNRFVHAVLKKGETYFFSGKTTATGVMMQPSFEAVSTDAIHTNRLVPLYTTTLGLKQGSLRRILKHVCDNLLDQDDAVATSATIKSASTNHRSLPNITTALTQLHFPSTPEAVIHSRERLALEELIVLIKHSQIVRDAWKKTNTAPALPPQPTTSIQKLPFALTSAQKKATQEILSDMYETTPMNRLLVGDVGSGKTIVAGLALEHCTLNKLHGCLVAPTQMLAEQHANTLRQFFPEIPLILLTGKGSVAWEQEAWVPYEKPQHLPTPHIIVGTHAVVNMLQKQQMSLPVGLVVYDEQHRFGVVQRTATPQLATPHILTMTATPIPRSLMLTIFSHLDLSSLNELPKNRVPTKTWVVTEQKREAAYQWLLTQMGTQEKKRKKGAFLTLVVCPFIDQSAHEGLASVASATERYETLRQHLPKELAIALLHGKQTLAQKQHTLKQLYNHEIDILVTTPIVEVGVDLPQASAIVIEAGERFGLASLHQLRGRVGRAGQQGYCLVFQSNTAPEARKRLKLFEHIANGTELAELDLQHRGAGDLFGTTQHGFDQLQFANWSNFELIATAQRLANTLPLDWSSVLQKLAQPTHMPVAN